jgi:transcription initiation factor TFIID subunit 2
MFVQQLKDDTLEWARITKTIEAKMRETNQPRSGTPSLKLSALQRKAAPAAPVPATPSPAPSGTARPTIKLKMGGVKANGTPLPTPSDEAALSTPKLKIRKPKEPKLSEVPPPEPRRDSYFDSADVDDELLEEVIAIEKEKDEERKQRVSAEKEKAREHRDKEKEHEREHEREREKEKTKQREEKEKAKQEQVAPKLIIGKRKKAAPVEDPVEDDEILALATPAKKEKSAASSPAPVAGPSSVKSSDKGSAKPSPTPTPALPAKNGVSKEVKSTTSAPKNPIKGKGKEVTQSSPVPKPKKIDVAQSLATPINDKRCKEILRTLTKIPEAAIFLRPVDTQLDGCPT